MIKPVFVLALLAIAAPALARDVTRPEETASCIGNAGDVRTLQSVCGAEPKSSACGYAIWQQTNSERACAVDGADSLFYHRPWPRGSIELPQACADSSAEACAAALENELRVTFRL